MILFKFWERRNHFTPKRVCLEDVAEIRSVFVKNTAWNQLRVNLVIGHSLLLLTAIASF